ncbi:TPA: hypothetical protein DIV55_02115 [Patescibacteria group bacterium]|nr:hypothetical protein [Patescibacteria group bacterium]
MVWDLSRASRNPVDSGTLGWMLQREILKGIITPSRIYLPQDNVLLLNVEFGMANQFLRDLSKNIRRGLENKLKQGWRPGGVPEGYINDKYGEKGLRKILKDPDRFDLVRKMWDLLLTGTYSVPQILEIVNKQWKYKLKPHKRMGNKPISRTGLYQIFTNAFYYGWFKYGGKWYKGKHDVMITEAEFNKAQAILGTRGKQRPKTREFSFTGMVRCGECNAMVTAEVKINRYGYTYVYYHCSKRINPKCTQKYISLDKLELQIEELLTRIEIPECFKDWAIKYLNVLHDKEAHDQSFISKNLDESYQNCIQKINNLIKLKISPANSDGSLMSDAEFETQMSELKKEKASLEEERKNLGKRVNEWLELSQQTFNFACYARMWFQHGSLQEKKEILQTIGSNFFLLNKLLNVDVLKPYIRVEESKKEVEKVLAPFEPKEKIDLTPQIEALFAQNTTLCQGQDSNLGSR